MPTIVTAPEWLSFDAVGLLPQVPLNTPGWKVLDYTSLRRRLRVGDDRVRPGVPGRLGVDREWDETILPLAMQINGRKNHEGTPYMDPFLGVDVNHQYLLDNIFDVLDARATTFHRRDGSLFTATLYVNNWEPTVDPNSGGDFVSGILTIAIPAGMLQPV